ncbi:MAG: hypothetical protein L6R37_004098 [Teloschistes peruensis]|nr:MAG: hypothetical protein L6R37_004098 [Teloschistes peruensis]
MLLLLFLYISQTLALPSNITNNIPGINCRGSFWCSLYADAFVNTAYRIATTGLNHPFPLPTFDPNNPFPANEPFPLPPPNPRLSSNAPSELESAWNLGPLNSSALYAGSNHVLCLPLDRTLRNGFCIFAQGVEGKGGKVYVSGAQVKRGLGKLVEHGCQMCGSVGLEDVDGGYLTVNYVSERVCRGICPEARYE